MMADDFTLKKKLGAGAYGEIYLSSKEGDNSNYVTTIIKKSYSKKNNFNKRLNNEIAILLDTNHPNIKKIFAFKETKNKLFLVTEYINGENLENYLEKNKPLSEDN